MKYLSKTVTVCVSSTTLPAALYCLFIYCKVWTQLFFSQYFLHLSLSFIPTLLSPLRTVTRGRESCVGRGRPCSSTMPTRMTFHLSSKTWR